jgi:D-apiose dehydrogenase
MSLRLAVIGCGYFARNHLHAWRDLRGEESAPEIAAVCDWDVARAKAIGDEFGVPSFSDPSAMLRETKLDFVDIAAGPAAHRHLVEMAAAHHLHVICQKPLAPALSDAIAMTTACRNAGVHLMVHENFRWQAPMRAMAAALDEGALGRPFYGRISFRSGHDVYHDQPYLRHDERFIIADLGVHLLDLARFFMGEVAALHCHTQRVDPTIHGEDVATIMLSMRSGGCCVVEASYASKPLQEYFPQTLVELETSRGSLRLAGDYELSLRSGDQVTQRRVAPSPRPWFKAPGAVVQDSVIAIQRHWLSCLQSGRIPETTANDNLHTLALVDACYRSAASGAVVQIPEHLEHP